MTIKRSMNSCYLREMLYIKEFYNLRTEGFKFKVKLKIIKNKWIVWLLLIRLFKIVINKFYFIKISVILLMKSVKNYKKSFKVKIWVKIRNQRIKRRVLIILRDMTI